MKRYYILHYFDPANVGSFLLVSLLGLILVLALVLLIAKLQIQRQLKEETEEKAKKYDKFVAGLEAFTTEHPEQAAAFREEVAYILDYTQPEVDLSIEEER